jgi:hypothetical protein
MFLSFLHDVESSRNRNPERPSNAEGDAHNRPEIFSLEIAHDQASSDCHENAGCEQYEKHHDGQKT